MCSVSINVVIVMRTQRKRAQNGDRRWTGQTSEGVTRPGSDLHLGTIFWGRIMKARAWGQRLCVCLWEREGGTVRCSGAGYLGQGVRKEWRRSVWGPAGDHSTGPSCSSLSLPLSSPYFLLAPRNPLHSRRTGKLVTISGTLTPTMCHCSISSHIQTFSLLPPRTLCISHNRHHMTVVFNILKQICCELLTSKTACWHLITYHNKAFCSCVFCRKLSLVKLQHCTRFCKLGNISFTRARGRGCEFSMEINLSFHLAFL